MWAGKCATCVHIKKILLSHPYIPHVFQNQFWWAGTTFRPSYYSSKWKNAQKRTSNKIFIYSIVLILLIHHYCGMFYNPSRVSVSNVGSLRGTQQAHVNVYWKFKICLKSQYFALWAQKCATCVHIKNFFGVSSINTSCISKSILVGRKHFPATLRLLKAEKCSKNYLKQIFYILFKW